MILRLRSRAVVRFARAPGVICRRFEPALPGGRLYTKMIMTLLPVVVMPTTVSRANLRFTPPLLSPPFAKSAT
jgi:hypothetical protein